MSILTDNTRPVKPADAEARYDAFRRSRAEECTLDHARRYEPTEFDLAEYARWLEETGAEAHAQDEPTPVEVLEAGADAGSPSKAPWWITLPESHGLDGERYTIADHYITVMHGTEITWSNRPEDQARMRERPRTASERWLDEAKGVRGRASRVTNDFDQPQYRHLG